MRRVLKYTLQNENTKTIQVPGCTDANTFKDQVLHVDVQRDDICIWCIADEEQPMQDVEIAVCNTGDYLDDNLQKEDFLGTVLMFNGSLVFHVFGRYKGGN